MKQYLLKLIDGASLTQEETHSTQHHAQHY